MKHSGERLRKLESKSQEEEDLWQRLRFADEDKERRRKASGDSEVV
jgi:hypothetical protein